ncbi:cytidine/deoxycytidylate deaminase family protein [Patescibacteria group bacterium]|nr:cytidine/deoxycytidylate deaminase family protein [Patescibacteria group bacterium]
MNEHAHARPSWDEYFIEIMHTVGKRGTCDRGQAGAVITRNNRILATGYAGAPSGIAHCDDVGHEMHTVTNPDGTESQHCIRTTHAEQNAIAAAARHGVSIEGGTLYCKMTPCYACAKLIINAGIKRVVALRDYHAGTRSKEVFIEANIAFDLLNTDTEAYDNQ